LSGKETYMPKRILITGASVAGNTVAAVLADQDFEVMVIEPAEAFRDGGQNVDVRGVGREVLRRLGLEAAALDHGTGEEGTVWVNEDGGEAARFAVNERRNDGPTAEMEILRGDLARLLYVAAKDRASYRFGEGIEAVEETGFGAKVTFASGTTETFDAVIVAEGVGSSTRELIFGGENDPRWMDMTIAYFTIPRTDDDDRMWRWFNAPGKRSVSLRPDQHGTTRAMLSLSKEAEGEQDWDVARQKAFLHERFADAGWETPRILAGMDSTDDFYFDVLRQVRMPRWSSGRVVLTGDAA
jgi:2-polyprenyl-6-methoxyphenol hydroxylase-like FAD-dependent oxidoreductase